MCRLALVHRSAGMLRWADAEWAQGLCPTEWPEPGWTDEEILVAQAEEEDEARADQALHASPMLQCPSLPLAFSQPITS